MGTFPLVSCQPKGGWPSLWAVTASLLFISLPASAAPDELAGGQIYSLSDFGPVKSAADADEAWKKATQAALAAGGGVVLIPAEAPREWRPAAPPQNMTRVPAPPAPAKSWGVGPGVTVVDARQPRLEIPPVTGLEFDRTFNLPPGDSAPHWSMHPMLRLRNNWLRGTSDIEVRLAAPVAAGKSQNIYLESVRGIFPGQELQVDVPNGGQLVVQSLGYDKDKKLPYFVADTPTALAAATRVWAVTRASVLDARTEAHNETQTFDIYNQRNHYSQGDTYMFDGYIHYMGDEYGVPHDPDPKRPETGYGSVLYNARTETLTNIFRATVTNFNSGTATLAYNGAENANTLGTGRPLINLNPKKWVTAGHAQVDSQDAQGGWALLNTGNSIWSTDAPWTADLVGRFFALDEDQEKVSGGKDIRLWFQITGFTQSPDGKKRLSVRRHWWGAKNSGVGISTLLDYDDYTFKEDTPKPLKYIIAPGTYVYDVSDGVLAPKDVTGNLTTGSLKLAPYSETGTKLDFAAGDPVEEALGPEPYHPVVFRAWTFDEIPGEFPAAILDAANYGDTGRSTVFSVAGSGGYWNVAEIKGRVKDVVRISGEVTGSIVRQRVTDPKADFWTVSGTNGGTLSFLASSGLLAYSGDWHLGGKSPTGVKFVGAAAGPAGANLRGLDIPVPQGVKAFDIHFPNPEADAQFTVTVTTNWVTNHAVTTRTKTGFHIVFDAPAPTGATLNWLLVR